MLTIVLVEEEISQHEKPAFCYESFGSNICKMLINLPNSPLLVIIVACQRMMASECARDCRSA
jgi:hypothetical protein